MVALVVYRFAVLATPARRCPGSSLRTVWFVQQVPQVTHSREAYALGLRDRQIEEEPNSQYNCLDIVNIGVSITVSIYIPINI